MLYWKDVHCVYVTGDRRHAAILLLRRRLFSGGGKPVSFRRSAGKYPVKQLHPEVDSQTIDTYLCRNVLIGLSVIDILLASPAGFEPARQRYLASQKKARYRMSYECIQICKSLLLISKLRKTAGIV